MPASKYVEPDGQFKPVDGSRFQGCVAAQMSKGLKREDAEKLCAYIGRSAGKIKGSAGSDACAPPAALTGAQTPAYNFRDNGDGTFSVLDVPIMAEVETGEKQNEKHIGRAWLQAAVEKSNRRFTEDGYKAPLHIEHHGTGKETEPAGFVMPKEVRRFEYEGRSVWAIFADLQVTPDVLEQVRQNKLPFRSVEIFDWSKPEIASTALLSSEVPYFRFPVLSLGDQIGDDHRIKDAGPAVASKRFALGSAILFSFQGGEMPEPTDAQIQDSADATRAPDAVADEASAKFADEAEVKDRELREVHDRVHENHDLLRRIAKKLGLDDGDDVEAAAEASEDLEISESVQAPVEQAALAAIQGKVNALESRERKRSEAAQLSSIVDDSMAKLAAWSPDDATRTSLVRLVATSKVPEETASTFVASFRSTVPMHAATFDDFDAMRGAADDSTVMKFADKGPDALADARRASAQYDELNSRGLITSTRDDFIAAQMNALPDGTLNITRR